MKQNNTYCPPQVGLMPMNQASNAILCASSEEGVQIQMNGFTDGGSYNWI